MKRIDFTVPIGLFIGLVAIGAAAAFEGIRPRFLWQPTALLVVLGGTLGAVVIRRGLSGVRCALRAAFALCWRDSTDELEATIARLAWLARAAQRDGVRVLESHAQASLDSLISEGLMLAADHAEPGFVRARLEHLLDDEDAQGRCEAATLEAAGGYAPTFGILGAVLGLITVLRSLADPTALGSGIATAFVATIYGVGLANLLLLPLASRLRERHEAHIKRREKIIEAVVALAAHESPNLILQRFTARGSTNIETVAAKARKASAR